ncbi:hypothetical protein [Tsukamurella sp. PLM1]|uniref:hypothetical protein n=1 Tax=Tsukamurella sp. PLM1 TaxID=2929795 RepID=UPI0020C0F977|nr:hypothetical protein [Tsukamurella sp. PLM1]
MLPPGMLGTVDLLVLDVFAGARTLRASPPRSSSPRWYRCSRPARSSCSTSPTVRRSPSPGP